MAIKCYSKFISLFPSDPEESFLSIFEKKRIKYLTENENEIKKEKLISQKLLSNSSKSNKFQSSTDNSYRDDQFSKKEKIILESLSPINKKIQYNLEKQKSQYSESLVDKKKIFLEEKMETDN